MALLRIGTVGITGTALGTAGPAKVNKNYVFPKLNRHQQQQAQNITGQRSGYLPARRLRDATVLLPAGLAAGRIHGDCRPQGYIKKWWP